MASYPSTVKTFVAKNPGDIIYDTHVDDLQDEVNAIETGLINGIEHALKPNTSATYALGTTSLLFSGIYANLGYFSHGTDPKLDLIYSGTGGKDFRFSPDGSGNLNLARYNQAGTSLEGTPLVLTATYAAAADGSAAAPSLSFQSATTTGFYKYSSGIGLAIAGTLRSYLTDTVFAGSFTDGAIWLRNATSNLVECHIRPSSGKKGYLTYTEDSVADRWSIGTDNGDATLYIRQGAYNGTAMVNVESDGDVVIAQRLTVTNQPKAIVYKTGAQELTTHGSTYTAISFDAETVDTGSLHDNSTNNTRLTIPTGGDGVYLLMGTVVWEADGTKTGTRSVKIMQGGATDLAYADCLPPATAFSQQVSVIVSLAATNYVELYARQDSGGGLDVIQGATYTKFMAVKLC